MTPDVDVNRLIQLRLVAQRRGGPDYDPTRCPCGNVITIADRGGACRECRLTRTHRVN